MNEHYTHEASPDAFDGDAISRADRAFLASLGDHPLVRHPLYGVPCLPTPDFDNLRPEEDKEAAEEALFATVVDWMLVNYAYREGAFISKGGAISLVDGEIISLVDLRGRMAPWELRRIGPRGGIKTRSPVDDWKTARARLSIRREEMRPERPRPTFTEGGYTIFNRYRPPAHPTGGGNIAPFEASLARLFPDDAERTWLWNYLAHKARRPWVPMIGVIMVAEEFGTGRGTLFDILELLFGKEYVVPCTFGELTGTSAAARFNARLADALFAVVNEAIAEDGHQQTQRRLHYDALKNVIDPSPTQRRRYEAKGQHAFAQISAMSTLIATQHRDVVKLPHDDRRVEVLTCGRKMTPAERIEIRTWMVDPENIGALHRALLMTPAAPLDVFDPFGQPPLFAGRLEMIGMGETRLEDAYGAAIDALEGCALFTLTQMLRLISSFGGYTSGDWSDKARYTVAKNAYRLRKRSESKNRITYSKRKEIVYARTAEDQKRWHGADMEMIVAALDRTEELVMRVIHGSDGEFDIAARLKEMRRHKPPEGDEE